MLRKVVLVIVLLNALVWTVGSIAFPPIHKYERDGNVGVVREKSYDRRWTFLPLGYWGITLYEKHGGPMRGGDARAIRFGVIGLVENRFSRTIIVEPTKKPQSLSISVGSKK